MVIFSSSDDVLKTPSGGSLQNFKGYLKLDFKQYVKIFKIPPLGMEKSFFTLLFLSSKPLVSGTKAFIIYEFDNSGVVWKSKYQ